MEELKACSHCGGEAESVTIDNPNMPYYKHKVKCTMCNISTGVHSSIDSASRSWNTRVDQSTDKLIDELVSEISNLSFAPIIEDVECVKDVAYLNQVLALLNSKRNKEV